VSESASSEAGTIQTDCVPADGPEPPEELDEQLGRTASATRLKRQAKERCIVVQDTPCYDARRAMTDERRPTFARDFPRTPALDELVDAFGRGDYARVRVDAPALEKASEDDAVRAAARTLVERTRPDPLVVRMFLVTGVLLVVLAAWWIARGKAPPGATQTAAPVERVRP
jgi:hypothetical protein